MRNIKVSLEYDGSDFFGFQKQTVHPTVQGVLEKALSRLLNRKTKICAASGRTDAGVHAEEQIVNFMTPHAMPLSQMRKGLNALLPKSVVVKEIREVGMNFHARYSAKSKIYEYRIWNNLVRSPLQSARVFHITEKLNLRRMRRAMICLKGRHDFRSFCSSDPSGRIKPKNTVRTIRHLTLKKEGSLIRIRIEANGFLYHMVRNIMGTLIQVGKGKLEVSAVKKILQAKDRQRAGPTAPANGLTLVKVYY